MKIKRIASFSMIVLAVFLIAMGVVYAQSVEDYTLLSSTFNIYAVQNNPPEIAVFTTDSAIYLEAISIYHWNGGKGATPGVIYLYKSANDELIGTFLASGRFNDTYWDCFPEITIEPGKYYIKDSGWETASWNANASGGMMELRGYKTTSPSSTVKNISQNTSQEKSTSTTTSTKYTFSSWAEKDIKRAMELDIIPESLNGNNLSEGINRMQFAAIAVKAYEKMAKTSLSGGSNPFNDTSDSYVVKAANANIVAGTSETTFSPYNGLTREQAATMLTRAYKKTVFDGWSLKNDYSLDYKLANEFADKNEISDYAKESVEYLSTNGVISGVGGNLFSPKGTLTKEQAIAIAVRMIDKLDMSKKTGKTTTNNTKTLTPGKPEKHEMTKEELQTNKKSGIEPLQGYVFDDGTGEHIFLDHYETITFDVSSIPEKERRNLVVRTYIEGEEPYYMFSDPEELLKGKFTIETTHYSTYELDKITDKEELKNVYCEKAAQVGVMQAASELELEKGMTEVINDTLSEYGLGRGQYGGEIARYILSHNSKGEILTAVIDGDSDTVKAKILNGLGEYMINKALKSDKTIDPVTGEEVTNPFQEALKQNLGDDAQATFDAMGKNTKQGYADALVTIVKNFEKSAMPYLDKVEKFGGLVNKLGDIFADDMMEWTYEKYYREWMNSEGQVSTEQWNIICEKMKGGLNRLTSKGITDAQVREYFKERYKHEGEIQARKKELMKFFDAAEQYMLFEDSMWPDRRPMTMYEKVKSMYNIREWLKEALKGKDGKYVKGKCNLMSDEDFLAYMVSMFTSSGKDRTAFFKTLIDQNIYTSNMNEIAKNLTGKTMKDIKNEENNKDNNDLTGDYPGKGTPFDPNLEITVVETVSNI